MSNDVHDVGPVDEMGPVDYLVVEFPHRRTPGEGLPLFLDLVDRGIIRVLDLAFIRKEADGSVVRLKLSELSADLAVFEGAASGLLDQTDIVSVAEAIAPDSAAGLLVYENRWAAPLAAALRRGGGQLVANGRIPVQALLAQLDAIESVGASS
ncbi:MAG: DUF1269 domain-containing protein [Chloroflexi bacterium]|nr:DUF1269 domain-containing protein [Chloroflexota bacterium]